jgi:hypothetical protein
MPSNLKYNKGIKLSEMCHELRREHGVCVCVCVCVCSGHYSGKFWKIF